MFGWRKKDASSEENLCPYCNSPNPPGAEQCSLCYYELNRSARDQPMAPPSSTDSEIMSTLLSEGFDEFEEEDAVEAVLTLDDVTVEVDQFELSNDEEEDFQFIDSSGPTLSETKDYQTPQEVQLEKSDAPTRDVDFVVPDSNPLEEVAEPVHTGQGSLFSVSSESDFSMEEVQNSAIDEPGKTNMEPQVINEMNEESDVDLTANAAVTKMDTPDIPEIPDSPFIVSTPIVPEIPEHAQTVSTTPPQVTTPSVPEVPEAPEVTLTPEIPDVPEVPEATSTPDIPDVPEKEVAKTVTDEQPKQAMAPTPQHNGRIWPWPAKQPWDERQVYREVVSMLESVKSGKLVQTAQTLDNLGPHLSINLEMLIHIGTVMRYLGREEHLQWMLKMAQTVYPNDERVTSAIAHLSN
ncbi:MAG: hypothetical protein P8Q95_00845 [Candidatus Poseidoniaceae archaeon]|nr:hypothetical protein [Candidatus Poseidoniaceae archaeon]